MRMKTMLMMVQKKMGKKKHPRNVEGKELDDVKFLGGKHRLQYKKELDIRQSEQDSKKLFGKLKTMKSDEKAIKNGSNS